MSLRPVSEALHAIVSSTALNTTPAVIASAIAGQRARIYRIVITAAAAVNVTVQDTGNNALSAPLQFVGTAPLPIVLNVAYNGDPLWQSGVGLGIQLAASAAVQVNADVWYQQGP